MANLKKASEENGSKALMPPNICVKTKFPRKFTFELRDRHITIRENVGIITRRGGKMSRFRYFFLFSGRCKFSLTKLLYGKREM